MDSIDMVSQWKQSGTGRPGSAGHPAGEIRLRAAGGLARRSVLLAVYDVESITYETVSGPAVFGEDGR
ncbi:hypothetical protein P3T36_000395 [Kitasatospora sp. MAP12-15]|uniref:hypothetical protein n=1 Tax=unclassified Kitasatospora TaxID=2633591 RepID=UPI00247370A6|nr:hypothetical protein [Kitasatospora sp. MAP12-44]MDH6109624.1 hypothetical protein [Kitasatospora sp. MAP12-44]